MDVSRPTAAAGGASSAEDLGGLVAWGEHQSTPGDETARAMATAPTAELEDLPVPVAAQMRSEALACLPPVCRAGRPGGGHRARYLPLVRSRVAMLLAAE